MRIIIGLRASESIISILPTGARKSILFIVLAIIKEGRVSIIIMPFIALLNNLVEQAGAIGVDYIRYIALLSARRNRLPRAARLVVVSADIIAIAKFSAYADRLLYAGLLQRIFINECYIVIINIRYRVRLGTLQSIYYYGCLLILLIAMLLVVLNN